MVVCMVGVYAKVCMYVCMHVCMYALWYTVCNVLPDASLRCTCLVHSYYEHARTYLCIYLRVCTFMFVFCKNACIHVECARRTLVHMTKHAEIA
jgi:hypothetical protein